MPVRDYEDVIEDTLTTASAFAERIFVLDNGSVDGTVGIVERLSRRLTNVEYLGVDRHPWNYGYYARIFQRVKSVARPGDWWYRLDADEFVVGDPRATLARVTKPYDAVFGNLFSYYFTDADLADYEADPTGWTSFPLFDRVRYYRNDWAEVRFVRHRRLMRWVDTGWPEGPLNVAPEMVPIRHFQYRSPTQIEQRLALRQGRSIWALEQAGYQDPVVRRLFIETSPGDPDWYRMIVRSALVDHDDGHSALRHRPDMAPPPPPLRGRVYRTVSRALAITPLYVRLLRAAGRFGEPDS